MPIKDPEKRRLCKQQWLLANPNYMREWYSRNPDKVKEYSERAKAKRKPRTPEQKARHSELARAHRAKYPERYLAASRRHDLKRKLLGLKKASPSPEKARQYRKNRLEKARPARVLYEAKRRIAAKSGHVSAQQWREIVSLFNNMCAYCLGPNQTMYHVVPLSNGGTHTTDNVVPCCKRCNFSKHNKPLFIWLLTSDTAQKTFGNEPRTSPS